MVFISRTTFFVIFTLTGSLWCLSLLPNSIVNNLLIILKPMTAITPLMTPCWTDTLLHCLVITLQRSSLHSTGTGFSHWYCSQVMCCPINYRQEVSVAFTHWQRAHYVHMAVAKALIWHFKLTIMWWLEF